MGIIEEDVYIAECKNILGTLQTGKKLWFWFCGANNEQALYLSELSTDPSMAILADRIQQTQAPTGVQQYVGLLHITASGQAEFISKKSSLIMLYEIANWCANAVQRIPELAYLYNSTMVEATSTGEVINRFSNPDIWKNIRPKAILGTTPHGIDTLQDLIMGETAWFALSQENHVPRLIVLPIAIDATGERFAILLKSLGINTPQTLRGTVFRGSQRLIFTCSKGNNEEQAFFSALKARFPTNPLLQTLKLFRIKGEKKKEIPLQLRDASPTEENFVRLSKEAQLLSSLNDKQKLFFYFCDEGEGVHPILLIEQDKDTLKSNAKSITSGTRSVRGTLSLSKGKILFQSQKYIENFVPALVAWVQAQSNPTQYQSLFGARFIQKTSEGILKKEKNDNAWTTINNA